MKASSVILDALKDIDNTGTLEAEKKMTLHAGQDIRMTTGTHREENGQGHTTAISKRGAASVTGKEGSLTMTAGKDIHLQAARISSAGDMTIAGKRQVELGTAVAEKDNRVTWDRSNDRRDSTAMETGSTLTAERNLTLLAGEDLSMTAAHVQAGKAAIIEAGRHITEKAGKNTVEMEEHHRHKEKGLLSSKTTTTYDEAKRTDTTGSIVEGDTLTMTAGKDITLKGSAAVSTEKTTLLSGNNISIDAAETENREIHRKQVKKSGLFGSGLGFTIGSEKTKDSYDMEETTQTGSTAGSVKGNVTITAGNETDIRASDIIAGQDSLIAGKNVTIESKDNTCRGKEEHEYKKSGLTVSLGGALITAKDNVIRPIKNAGQAHDGLLGKLYAADAGFNLHDAVKTYKNIGDVKKGITLDVSIGSRSAKSDSRYQGTEAKESRIVSQGNIRIKSDENIAVKGSQITGENVTLQAGKDISLTAAENRKTTEGNSRSKGAGITASFGIGGLQNVGISAGKSKGNMEEEIMTHTGSAVTAKETLAMESGKDLNITGSKAGGKKVEVKTGNNLSIESLQDSHTYHSRDKESGIHLQRDITVRPDTGKKKMDDPYFSIGKKTDTTDSTYISVTKQAGIYAGKEGYDIQVKNNTRLKGAVIDSQAEKEKNKLTTGALTWENIENKAEYKAKAHGMTASTQSASKLNPAGLGYVPAVPVKGEADSTTYSAIADSIITTTKEKTEKEIRHDTENALNKLSEIFDKKKIEEKQELVNLMSQTGFTLIGDIADRKESELKRKAEEARKNNNSMEAETYEKAAGKWSESGTNRILLHGMLGAILSKEAGNGTGKGLTGAGLNAALQKELGKIKDKEVHKIASAAIGYIAGKETGAAIAWQATTYNYLSPKQNEQYQKELEEAKTEKEKTEITNKWLQIDETQKEKWLKKQEAGTYTDLSTIKDGYLPGVVILGNSNYSDFNWIQSATLNGLGAVTNIPWSGIDDKLLVTLPVRYRNAFGILGKTGILGAGAASFISIYNDYRIYSGGDLRKALAYDVGGTAANIFLSTGTAGMLTAAGIATVPGIFIGAGIAVGGGILIDRGIDTLKQDLILDKDKQLDNKGRGENN